MVKLYEILIAMVFIIILVKFGALCRLDFSTSKHKISKPRGESIRIESSIR